MNGHLKDLECGGRPMTKNELKIKKLEQENQQLKSKLEASEKARKEGVEFINKELEEIGKHQYAVGTRRLNKIKNILDIDKGE